MPLEDPTIILEAALAVIQLISHIARAVRYAKHLSKRAKHRKHGPGNKAQDETSEDTSS